MEKNMNIQSLTFRDYMNVIFRHIGKISISVIVMVTTIIVGVMFMTPVYKSKVTMIVAGKKKALADYYTDIRLGGSRSDQITSTQVRIVKSDPVIERSVSVLGLAKMPLDYEKGYSSKFKKPFIKWRAERLEKKIQGLKSEQKEAFLFRFAMERLRQQVQVKPIRQTDLIQIEVSDYNPMRAAITANIVSRSYIIFDLEQQLAEMQLTFGRKNLSVIQLEEAIKKMKTSLSGKPLATLDAIGPATVKIIEQAKIPIKPYGTPKSLVIILGVFLSFFMSIMGAFTLDYMDQTFKSPQETQSALDVEYLGFLPQKPKPIDYQKLSEQIYLNLKNKGVKCLLFVSATKEEGITSIIANLGNYISEKMYKKVLLIDANLRNPGLHKHFRFNENKNIIKTLKENKEFEKKIKKVNPNLDIFTSGLQNVNPVVILESKLMQDLITEAKNIYDLIIIDSPPLGEFDDALLLSAFTDSVIPVVSEKKTRKQVIINALKALKNSNIYFLGMIFNNRKFVIPKFIYKRI